MIQIVCFERGCWWRGAIFQPHNESVKANRMNADSCGGGIGDCNGDVGSAVGGSWCRSHSNDSGNRKEPRQQLLATIIVRNVSNSNGCTEGYKTTQNADILI